MLWSALALEENYEGMLYTVDDGSEWKRISTAKEMIGDRFRVDYDRFVKDLILEFQIYKRVKFINEKISIVDVNDIDILFSDFAHGVFDVTKLLADYLPKMNEHAGSTLTARVLTTDPTARSSVSFRYSTAERYRDRSKKFQILTTTRF